VKIEQGGGAQTRPLPKAPSYLVTLEDAGLRAARLWPWWSLAVITLLGPGLWLWRLAQNGYGNAYYTAGVRSMIDSRHNFFFNAFDPECFIA